MKYDAIIIGFGKGAKTLAGTLGKKGKKVALIEKSKKMYGGTCINIGCIPSKTLVLQSEKSPDDKSAKAEHYRKSVQHKKELIAKLNNKNYGKIANIDTVDVIDGVASFEGPHNILVKTENGEELHLESDNLFINTGATTVIPPIKGVEENENVYISETLMDEEELPEKLTIVGGGYIGLEFASMYANYGSEVTVLEYAKELIGREDRDIADEIKTILENKGVKFILGAAVKSIEGDTVIFERDGKEEKIENTKILLATGRKPNTEGLNLEAAGVELGERGLIKVNEKNETTAPGIWAMGDVSSSLQFTYISLDDFRVVKSQLLEDGSYTKNDRKNVPYTVFITPNFSRVGLSEKEALSQGYEIKVGKLAVNTIPKALVMGKPEGLLKVVVDAKTEKILGAMLICEESQEMINLIKLAMDQELSYKVLRDGIYTHPTMTESFNDLFAI